MLVLERENPKNEILKIIYNIEKSYKNLDIYTKIKRLLQGGVLEIKVRRRELGYWKEEGEKGEIKVGIKSGLLRRYLVERAV